MVVGALVRLVVKVWADGSCGDWDRCMGLGLGCWRIEGRMFDAAGQGNWVVLAWLVDESLVEWGMGSVCAVAAG